MKISVLLKNEIKIKLECKKMTEKYNDFCNKQPTCKECIYGELPGDIECIVKFAEDNEIDVDLE